MITLTSELVAATSRSEKAPHNFKTLSHAQTPQRYVSQFEHAVENFEEMMEEEKILKGRAVHMRLASYFQ